jgi:hypothetical protein
MIVFLGERRGEEATGQAAQKRTSVRNGPPSGRRGGAASGSTLHQGGSDGLGVALGRRGEPGRRVRTLGACRGHPGRAMLYGASSEPSGGRR